MAFSNLADPTSLTNGKHEPYTILPQFHSAPAELRVINVGAGAAGLLLAFKMKKLFQNYELVCYEKNPAVGGTWYENRYPGCACDIPAHVYTYSFEPNPNWSSFYAYSPEIRQYFEDFAAKYDLMPYVRLNSKVLSATWVEERGIYEVEVQTEGKVIKDWCHVLINGTGFLNSWKWPTIPGLHSFGGKLMHSADWDPTCDWKDKDVAVIGTGSSAIQIIPQIQKTAKHLTTFMRSVTWISPPASEHDLRSRKAAEPSAKQPEGAQYYFTEAEKRRFREDPEYHLQYRKGLEQEVNSVFSVFIAGSDYSKGAEEAMRAEMIRRIGPGHEDLAERLIPTWPPGCRRITPGDGYLEALIQPNVTRVHKEIAKVERDGIVDEDGTFHKADILVCATGFNLAFAPPFNVRGVDGVTMADEFNPEPYVYLAVTVPKFPNYFIINGVRGNWASGCALPSHEVQVEYILKCVKRIQTQGIRAFEVKREPIDQLYEHIDEWHKGSVWNMPCKSWYKNNIIGGKLWIWAGSSLHYMQTLKDVQWEDYTIRYFNKNKFAYLGNGRVEAEVLGKRDLLAPYIRNSDVPWSVQGAELV
ncbi:cyclohexanone monooxygenase [Lepidopterella palustris CBS 459.81]|uniref:Cyclohexanone monooxygenase n=1 Tax=Lepidopterella palustris CBS 459.81 TaxID=1314670 RepID=A0A8E2JHS7_9PEZI|nr:cyclohexanone monooxygenase [Lepidopterella palustris CBS 459.81]